MTGLRRWYRKCEGCAPGKPAYDERYPDPDFSILLQISTLGQNRRQKSTGALPLCAACLDALAQGKMPKPLKERIQRTLDEIRR